MAGLFDESDGGLVTYWKTFSAITDLVGAGTAARIYPHVARQVQRRTAGDYIEYMRGGGESENHHAGVSGTRTTIVYVFCYSATYSGSDALAEAVRTNTANYRGTLSGVYVNRILHTHSPDSGVDVDDTGGEKHRYWTRLIFHVIHAEAVGV